MYIASVCMSVNNFLRVFLKRLHTVTLLYFEKSRSSIFVEKKIVLNWVIFAPILAQIPGLFRSGNPLYEFFWNFVWSHKSEYMAQKLICIVLEIHYKSFIQIFRDHQSIEVNQSNNNKYFNKKKLELTPKLGILPSNS